jgi:hypothetical protein
MRSHAVWTQRFKRAEKGSSANGNMSVPSLAKSGQLLPLIPTSYIRCYIYVLFYEAITPRSTYRGMIEWQWIMNWELRRRKRSLPNLRHNLGIFLEALSKTTKLSAYSLSPGPDLNLEPPEYERVSRIRPQLSESEISDRDKAGLYSNHLNTATRNTHMHTRPSLII